MLCFIKSCSYSRKLSTKIQPSFAECFFSLFSIISSLIIPEDDCLLCLGLNTNTVYFVFLVSSSQSKPSLSNSANVGGKAMNSIKKAVAIKNDSEEAKPLVTSSNGR